MELVNSKDALLQHIKRANYESLIRRQANTSLITAPSRSGHGWKVDINTIDIVWMILPPSLTVFYTSLTVLPIRMYNQ